MKKKYSWIPNPIRRKVAISSQGKCYHCGKKAFSMKFDQWGIPRFFDEKEIVFEYDHLKAQMNGGKTTLNNIVLSCRSCNRTKKRIPMSEIGGIENLKELFF